MSELAWVLDLGFVGVRFYDLPNFLICVFVVIFAGRLYRVSPLIQLVLLAHCVLPYFLNGVIFPYSYMPDVFKYWRDFNAIRDGDIGLFQALSMGNVKQASALFSMMPFPFAVTPLSLGFFNSFIYISLFFWLYRKRVFTPVSILFYLAYPSLALYTGLGLRDTLVFLLMIVSLQWAREGRFLICFIPLFFLYLIKFQNFFIIGPLVGLYYVLGVRNTGVSVGKFVVIMVGAIFVLFALTPVVLPEINRLRAAMYVEDGGAIGDVELISGATEFVLAGLLSGLYFLAKPFPWEVSNSLQLIQSAENLVVLGFLFMLVCTAWRTAPRKLMFWLLFMALALTVYGLVVFNYGTAARYRYPFVVIFVLFVCADCEVRRVLSLSWHGWRRRGLKRTSS